MKRFAVTALVIIFLFPFTQAQNKSNAAQEQKNVPPATTVPVRNQPEEQPEARTEEPKPQTPAEAPRALSAEKAAHWDMREVAPVTSKHQVTVNGKTLHYTASAGRLPIRDISGNTEAEMFFVAYTLDGADPSRRPVTFAFNGGPGSASIWLHMGALGPRKVALQKPEGTLPQPPYRLEDNPYTPLDKTDIVLIDAIGTGFSRPADLEKGKKFWGLRGDIEAFGEFIRMYITRYERWSSPLFILGESYGTTRAAGISGYLSEKGINFAGISLLSSIIDYESVLTTRRNNEGYINTLPSYTMVAYYHKKLAPELLADQAKTRAQVEAFAAGEYSQALAKGDTLGEAEHNEIVNKLAYFTGLKKDVIEQVNMLVDVRTFTTNLLSDQKLVVGRLDGRYAGPNPNTPGDVRQGGPQFFDPTSANTQAPFSAVFNDYIRRELGYRTDMPYAMTASDLTDQFRWDWGNQQGFADTASALRSAMAKNPWLKVQVLEGYYDLATPYFAANYAMNHLDLPPQFRKNISYATYEAGHMMYLHTPSHAKLQKDYESFMESCLPKE
ncbi:MAG TPA: peptidase S10 [candidate division Zixibacteria bacterium]|nr:peptidase S10 [candidate division Zixibacteria bacterium]